MIEISFQTVKPSPQYQIIPVQPIEPEIVKLEEFPKSESPLYSKITPPKIKPFNINLKDTDGKWALAGQSVGGFGFCYPKVLKYWDT